MSKNKKEQIYTGKYDSNSKGFGFVSVDGFARDLFIPQGCSAGAMYGDTVEVRILKGSLNEYGLDDGRGHRAEAEVIRIVERGIKSIVGTYHALRKPVQKQYYRGAAADGEKGAKGGEWKSTYVTYNIAGYVEPDHPKIPFKVDIPVKAKANAMEGHKVVADIALYSGDGENPVGAISEVLGHVNDPGVDILSLVKSYGIPTEFPEEVLKEAEKLPDRIDPAAQGSSPAAHRKGNAAPAAHRKGNAAPATHRKGNAAPAAQGTGAAVPAGRKDLRAIPTVTIDGEDTKDIDDAISLVREGDHQVLGVHIADVAEYVTEGSALDKEALNRGTSVYPADRVIPMLPTKLSNGICSLNAGEDRFALSCLMTIGKSGEVIDYEITESVIHVDARLSYNGVMRLFTDNDDSEIADSLRWQGYRGIKGRTREIARMLRRMKKLAATLRRKREKRGSIDFDFPEAKVVLNVQGEPVEIVARERSDATDLIEDFMLLANETVAKHCVYMEIPAVYRVHAAPAHEKMRELALVLRGFGYKFRPGQGQMHPAQIRHLLEKIKGSPEEGMLSRMILRCMQKAQYATSCEGHFGLALSHYCHFTSPIRRYPDLLVHRSLKYWLRGEMNAETIDRLNASLPGAAFRSSATEQRAAEAERETIKLKKAQYMEGKVGEVCTGVISGITSWGIYVELPDTVEGMIRISDLTDDFYTYDEKQYILVGEYTGRKYTLGQKMTVIVAAADRVRRTIDFVPCEDRTHEPGGRGPSGKSGKSAGPETADDKHGREGGNRKAFRNSGEKRRKKIRGPFLDRTGRVLAGKDGRHRSGRKVSKGKGMRRKGRA